MPPVQTPGPATAPTAPTAPTPKPVIAGGAEQPPAQEGGTSMPPEIPVDPNKIPDGAVAISVVFFVSVALVTIFLPIARAFARRMDRSHALPERAGADPASAERLARMEQAIDSIAIEVERISEGQRFTTKLLSERAAEPAALPGRELR